MFEPRTETLPLTGERTVPGVAHENYWFRRHEAVYEELLPLASGRIVLEAGSGEGYGANLLAGRAQQVVALDYDEQAIAHTLRRYPRISVIRGNLAQLPIRSESIGLVVNLQVIEHLWDQVGFLRECRRVLQPGELLAVSTPNRITFSPGRDTPLNPFHTRELDPAELVELTSQAGFETFQLFGLYHGARLNQLDAKHLGGLIGAQTELALSGRTWPDGLLADVQSVTTADFELRQGSPAELTGSMDLLILATAV